MKIFTRTNIIDTQIVNETSQKENERINKVNKFQEKQFCWLALTENKICTCVVNK